MANVCESCHEVVYRTRFVRGRWLGLDCRCFADPPVEAGATNPYADLTIEHVYGDDNKPIRVTSARQLREAEKRFEFCSVVANMESRHFDDAPQQRVIRVEDVYKRKFRRGS
jgi:hypothetical protein